MDEQQVESTEELVVTKCAFCGVLIESTDKFCHACGGQTKQADPKELLGVDITDDDLMTYITKGFIEKDIPIGSIGGKPITLTIRNMTQKSYTNIALCVDTRMQECHGATPQLYDRLQQEERLKEVLVSINGKHLINGQAVGDEIAKIALFKTMIMDQLILIMLQKGQIQNF
jgi:hypothetical protein